MTASHLWPDVKDKGQGEYLMKAAHEVEVDGMEDRVLYAEYLTYRFPR